MAALSRWFVCARSGLRCANRLNSFSTRNVPLPRFFYRHAILLAGRRYTDKHEWVEVDGSVATVGISDYAQDQLGDIVYAQLPEADTQLDQDEECGALESVKAASELYSPLSGTVTVSNSEVVETPAVINESPLEKGWLWQMELSKAEEVDSLMDEDAYQAFVQDID